MTSKIVVENLNVHYGERHALKNISINIPDKQITAIIGPSGCGKTTLLKCFNRLIDTYDSVQVSGRLLIDNEDIFDKNAELTHIRRKMGLVSQRPYPLPMSIFDNIAYGLKIHGETDKAKISSIVEEQLKSVSLWDEVKDRLQAPASRLSIGQQQRLCLARGLAVQPQIILGDEPTSALDPISSKHIEEKFLELKEKYTLIVVTHSLTQAKRIADNVVFMYFGEIVEYGTATQILENPQLERTKEYVFGKIS
jgi:phosphate transport system ATP-binding protein